MEGEFFVKKRRNLLQTSMSFDSVSAQQRNSSGSSRTILNSHASSGESVDLSELLMVGNKKSNLEKEIQTINSSGNLSIENFCWLAASIICVYFSDIFNVILKDQRIYRYFKQPSFRHFLWTSLIFRFFLSYLRSLMMASFSLIGVNIFIAFYLIIWLTHVKKVDSSKWNESHPTLIPIATACFISGSILYVALKEEL
jgi:hypothetical protein